MKIIKLRTTRGLTQAQLAKLCDTTQQQIAKIENGIVDPKLSTLRKLAEALGCELTEFFWTSKEFISEINTAVRKYDIDLKKCNLIELNVICAKKMGIPAFHPYWERVQLNRSKNIASLK